MTYNIQEYGCAYAFVTKPFLLKTRKPLHESMADQKKFSLQRAAAGKRVTMETPEKQARKIPKVSEMQPTEARPSRVTTNAPVVPRDSFIYHFLTFPFYFPENMRQRQRRGRRQGQRQKQREKHIQTIDGLGPNK